MRQASKAVLAVSLFLFTLQAVIVLQTDTANAIPAFARNYKMSCNACHAPFPRINNYGDEFAGNGFAVNDQDDKRQFVETGDENLDLLGDLPLAVRIEGFIKHQSETERNIDLTTPYNVKLLSGGSITKNIAYYFYFFFSERGEVAGLEDAFVMFNNLFNSEFDIYVGQFQVSDPLFKRELRLTYEDYQIYRTAVGLSDINLTYDRGVMLTYGFESGTDIVVEIVNGSGLGHADRFHTYDDDKYKNLVGRVSQDMGEYVRGGLFGYYGKEAGLFNRTNEVWMLAGDATITPNDKFELDVQGVFRQDNNPNFMTADLADDVDTKGGFIELLYMPEGERSQWYAAGLYNVVDSDINSDDYETITAHYGYLLRTNIRLIVEDTYDILNEENRFVVGFICAF